MVLLVAGWLNRHQQQAIVYLRAENRVLRDRIVERRLRFTNEERRMLALAGESVGRAALRVIATLASPETVLGWYRELVARKYSAPKANGASTCPKRRSVEEQVLRMAKDNPSWGYTRIRGALRNIGVDAGRSTIARILKRNGLHPALERSRIPSWKTFLEAHRGAIAAADFLTVEVLTMRGLIRHVVFFVIDVTNRCVQVAGITRQPEGAWMDRMAAQLTDANDGFLRGKRVLITDRDPLYTVRFRETLEAAGTTSCDGKTKLTEPRVDEGANESDVFKRHERQEAAKLERPAELAKRSEYRDSILGSLVYMEEALDLSPSEFDPENLPDQSRGENAEHPFDVQIGEYDFGKEAYPILVRSMASSGWAIGAVKPVIRNETVAGSVPLRRRTGVVVGGREVTVRTHEGFAYQIAQNHSKMALSFKLPPADAKVLALGGFPICRERDLLSFGGIGDETRGT
jgi:putative transposase